jgi:hypothetical protein
MMKKLLIFMLVLGMASFASASLNVAISVNGSTTGPDEITLQVSDTITIDIYDAGGVPPYGQRNYGAYLDFQFPSMGCYALSNPRLGPAAGDMASWSFATYAPPADYDEYTVSRSFTPQAVGDPAGAIFLVDFHCETPDNIVYVYLYHTLIGGGSQVIDTLTIHQVPIPEPMTVTLLGLGGLLLRRRK